MTLAVAKQEKRSELSRMKPKDIEAKIIELGKQNIPPEKIGLILRDQYGVAKAKLIGKKISQVLKEANIKIVSESENFSKKHIILKKHMEKNRHDYSAKKAIIKYASRINKLKKLENKQ